jgi:hypothetical protein
MKNIQKVTRLKLNSLQETDYLLIGLVSSEPDYKLSLLLNKKLSISLKNIPPIRINGDGNSEFTFSVFSNRGEQSDLNFNLISNRSGKNFFLSKLKNIDYLLQILLPDKKLNPDSIISNLREIEAVNAVFNIDFSILKDKNLHYLIQ